ncbi:hypothetical protein CBR_g743 [Chara braunii]|uniref:Uncharacterized protein n=1 Tax=Chara braunii TaxID=69332 RepID=A0A388KCE1_CHABU|nr:hypothetical protein CBR_g743 [Chara braunii]|eukprot:GBG67613.1 hypothetical protein CBR_g743 [Chara braunii]
MVEEECGDIFGTVRGCARDEVGMFGQAADNDVDAIMPAVGLGEAAHEVHGDGLLPDGGDDGVVSADGEVLSVEVRAPDCEGVNHGEEFLLVGGVIHLRGKELLACEGDRVFARWSLGVSGRVLDGGGLGGVAGEMLGQYGSDGKVGGVSNGVGDLEDRGRGDGLLDGDNMAEVFDAQSGKRTFAELGVEFLLSEDRGDLAEVLKVGLEGGAEDKDVIKVDNDTDFEEVAEDVVHGGLEGSGGIGGVLDAPDEGGGGGNGMMVGIEGLVDMAVEVVGVEEVGGGVLLEAAVEEGVVCAVEVGVVCIMGVGVVCAAVTTVMEGVVPSSVVTRSHMDDMLDFMSSREAVTEVRRVFSAWRMAERSRVAVFVGGCSPARLRAMLST